VSEHRGDGLSWAAGVCGVSECRHGMTLGAVGEQFNNGIVSIGGSGGAADLLMLSYRLCGVGRSTSSSDEA